MDNKIRFPLEDVKQFDLFYDEMLSELLKHMDEYKDSWKHLNIAYLEERITKKLVDYELTKNKHKLISLANLAMLLYVRKNANQKMNYWK